MSESNLELNNLTNEELIDLALNSTGKERENTRIAALLEHFNRIKNSDSTLRAPAGDETILEIKIKSINNNRTGDR